MRKSIIAFCRAVGADPLLVQGAGGNVSWKEGDTLWIKASGTWLADADMKDIFVPVDLSHLKAALAVRDFSVTPRVYGASELRPSIETLLHALMPQPVVVHLHAVELLAHLVRDDCEQTFDSLMTGSVRWASVPYRKPGAALAQAVAEALARSPGANVVFLRNHGVVIGGADTAMVERTLSDLISLLATQPHAANDAMEPPAWPLVIGDGRQYIPVADIGVQRLALDGSLYGRLAAEWVLYPDHVVFLGPRAACYADLASFTAEVRQHGDSPELVFVRDVGVYAKPGFSLAKLAQLRCYYEVLIRQRAGGAVRALSGEQIAELLDWDAEKYRIQINS